MYISSTEQMITELINNSVDEYTAGYCTTIAVGITGGLHGVGASCVNALSEYCNLIIKNNGRNYELKFEKCKTVQALTKIESGLDTNNTGTEVRFKINTTIWKDEKPNISKLRKRLEQLTYLNPRLLIYLYVDRGEEKLQESYQHNNRLKEYMEKLISKNTPIIEPFTVSNTIKAIDNKTGARGLRTIIEDLLLKYMYSLPDDESVEEIIITKETILNKKEPIIMKKEKVI